MLPKLLRYLQWRATIAQLVSSSLISSSFREPSMAVSNIVLYPSPGRGHIASMVELGNQLLTHHPDSFSVTVIVTAAAPSLAAANKSLNFHLLPSIEASVEPFDLVGLHNPNLRHALVKIPNVKALIADFFCSAAAEVAAGINIATYYYFTSGANGLAMFLYHETLHKTFTRNFADLGDEIVSVPGLPPIPASQMPVGILDRNLRIYDYLIESSARIIDSAGIIVNTFDVLDERAVRAIVAGDCVPDGPTPPIYCVGPLISAAVDDGADDRHECVTWLDSQPSRSVLFLSFGSIGSFSKEQVKEIAAALERSAVRFLWVIRSPTPGLELRPMVPAAEVEPDLDLESILPEGFTDRTRERGYVLRSWAPQVAVLSHDSVGGFVTHCGWNSILEAVVAGVPMIAWPLYAEQKLNRAFLVEEAKAALTVAESGGGFVSATELEERVAELMDSEKGRAVRERVEVLRERAKTALSQGGSSRKALVELAESLK